MERREWRLRHEPLGWLAYLGPLPLVLALVSSLHGAAWYTPRFWVEIVLIVLLVAAGVWAAGRLRVRLTEAGVEVRQLRTRLYPWKQIAAAQLTPERDQIELVLLTQALHPRTQTEILPLPRGRGRRPSDATLRDAVAAIERRIKPPQAPDQAV